MEKGSRSSIPDSLGYGEESTDDSLDMINDLASDMDSLDSGQKDPWEKDLGWGDTTPEEEEDPKGDEPEGDDPDPEEEEGDDPEPEEEEEEGDDPEEEEEDDPDADEPEGDEPDEEEEEDEGPLYDAARDFPDDGLPPTTYKDRVALNNGVAAKMNYTRELIDQLNKLGSGVGAIELPSIFNGDESTVDQPFNREAFLEVDNDSAKKTVAELDAFIKNVKSKIQRVETEVNTERQQVKVSNEYRKAVDDLVAAIKTTGIKQADADKMTYQELVDSIDAQISDLEGEKGEDYVSEHGAKGLRERFAELEKARKAVESFPDAHRKHEEQQKSKQKATTSQPSPEEMQKAYQEWEKDQPSLPIHKHQGNTGELKRAFMEYVKAKVLADPSLSPGQPRDWHNLYKMHQDDVKREMDRLEQNKKVSQKKEKATQMKADKTNKKKPDPRRVKSEGNYSRNELSTDSIDSELDDLAKDMDQNI